MNRLRTFLQSALFPLALALGAGVSTHAQVLADLAGDYATTGGPLAATGTGTWTYYASDAANPLGATLSQLTYQTELGDPFISGYGLGGHDGYNVPAVANVNIFGDGAMPGSSFLAWHPGNTTPEYTVLTWTAGAGESGSISIDGTFSREGEPPGSVNFYIIVNGVEAYIETGILQGQQRNFNLSASIAPGQTVSFVLDPNGLFNGDESLISATISMAAVPEPSTYALLAGLACLAAVVVRRRTATPLFS